MTLYSQEALSKAVGMERRALRQFIEDKDIQPVTDERGKDGRRLGKYKPADIFRAQHPERFADGMRLAGAIGRGIFHPESPLMKAIHKALPEGDPMPALKAIIEAGWDSIEDVMGEHSAGRQ